MYEGCIDELEQYKDKNGRVWVSLKIKDDKIKKWIEDCLSKYSLQQLTSYYPYIVLVLDKNTGRVVPQVKGIGDARYTNYFHILAAKESDNKLEDYVGFKIEDYFDTLGSYHKKESYIENIERRLVEGDKEKSELSLHLDKVSNIKFKPPETIQPIDQFKSRMNLDEVKERINIDNYYMNSPQVFMKLPL